MNMVTLMAVALAGWMNRQQQEVIEPEFGSTGNGEVNCRERLRGLLRYYHREAA